MYSVETEVDVLGEVTLQAQALPAYADLMTLLEGSGPTPAGLR
jgi:hypothetical protein